MFVYLFASGVLLSRLEKQKQRKRKQHVPYLANKLTWPDFVVIPNSDFQSTITEL